MIPNLFQNGHFWNKMHEYCYCVMTEIDSGQSNKI